VSGDPYLLFILGDHLNSKKRRKKRKEK